MWADDVIDRNFSQQQGIFETDSLAALSLLCTHTTTQAAMTVTAAQLSEYVDRHWGPLLVWVGQADGVAEDVVQQTFIALSSVAEPPENPVAWLFATARNIAINERKKLRRGRSRQRAVAVGESRPCEIWKSQQAADLAEQLERLSEELREAVVAHIWGGMTFDEIAIATNRSKATVWRQYQRALNLLRESVVSYDQ